MDFVSKTTMPLCNYDGCHKESANYGLIQGGHLFCKEHKTSDMVNLSSNKCQEENCNTVPSFGIEHGKRTHCGKHKTSDMIDLINSTCRATWCTTQVKRPNKYDEHCTHCFKYLFPHDERTSKIRVKTKEELVRDTINENFEGFEHDKPITWNECDCTMRRRIDHRKLIDGTMLAIETDEHQHRSYDAEDEGNRYEDVFVGAHSGKWIFIRFNPDAYTDSKGIKHKGMFDSKGLRNGHEVERRMKILIDEIKKQIKRITSNENTEFLEITKLFYDRF